MSLQDTKTAVFKKNIVNGSIFPNFFFTFLTDRIFFLFPCRIIVVQSEESEEDKSSTLTADSGATSESESGVNLFILAGHEAMQL